MIPPSLPMLALRRHPAIDPPLETLQRRLADGRIVGSPVILTTSASGMPTSIRFSSVGGTARSSNRKKPITAARMTATRSVLNRTNRRRVIAKKTRYLAWPNADLPSSGALFLQLHQRRSGTRRRGDVQANQPNLSGDFVLDC